MPALGHDELIAWQSPDGNIGLTSIGGLAIKFVNKTGSNTVKGTIIEPSLTNDNAFAVIVAAAPDPLGVVFEDGIADGQLVWVIIQGIVDVLLEDTTASTRHNWCKVSDTQAGRVDATNAVPPSGGIVQADEHFREIGHCLQSVGSGTDVLMRMIIHFN